VTTSLLTRSAVSRSAAPASVIARSALALGAGVLLSGAFEPFARAWLIPLSLATLVLAVRGLPVRCGWAPGLAFGLGFCFTHLVWMRAIGPDAWVSLSVVQGAFFGLLGALLAPLSRLRGWPVWTAFAWVAIEQFRGQWPLGGLPWGRLAYASMDTPVAGWAPYVGSTGTSLVWALLGTGLAWTLLTVAASPLRTLSVAAVALAVSVLPVLAPYAGERGAEVTVAAVQGDVPGDGTDVLLDHRQVTANHVEATIDLAALVADGGARPDLVVWPENSTAVDPFLDGEVNSGISRASLAIDAPILVGAIVQGVEPDQVLNQGVVWEPGTGGGDRYTKRHPVPYGEYIPFREQLPWSANFGRLREIGRDMLAGVRRAPLRVGPARVVDSICFDVAYDDGIYDQVRAGGDLLVVQTSNAMFINTAQVEQQFAISRLRAIETGKYVVVAATNGVSGIVDPRGEVVERAEIRSRSVVVQELTLSPGTSPGVRVGPVLGWGVLILTGAGLFLAAGLGHLPYRRERE
jgi:apolipoprotein N-acyltransferase